MLKLGVVYKNGSVINHRSLLKVLLNPVLRYFGYYIASKFDNNHIGSIQLLKGQKTDKIKFDFNYLGDYDLIEKKRILF